MIPTRASCPPPHTPTLSMLLNWSLSSPVVPQMFVALIFWYQFYCGFSGSAMIDQWYLIFFNLMFSAFPQLITGTLDKDVSAETLQQLPQLYVNGQNSEVGLFHICIFDPDLQWSSTFNPLFAASCRLLAFC